MNNIVFILTDDQTLNTIEDVNNDQIITPNLKKLVKEGTFFNNAHFPSGTSGAMCMPSRAMIHTSKTLFELENEGQTIAIKDKLLGEVLLENGFKCHGIGKWHNSSDAYARSFSSGENIFFGGMWDHYNVPVNDYDYTGKYDNTIKYITNFFENNSPLEMTANKVNNGIHSTNMITDSALSFFKDKKEDPFFLYVSYLAPHDPRVSDDEFKNLYDLDKIKIPENYLDKHPFDFGQEKERDEKLLSRPFDTNKIKAEIRDYYAMISHLDHHIGKILDQIDFTNTTVIFTSDNGLCLARHGLLGKQNHYEESIRVPLIFKGPNIKKNTIIDEFIYLHDIYPTILDMSNINIPPEIRGKSFKKMFETKYSTRSDLYFAFNDYIRSYKDKNYKIIIYRNGVDKQIIRLYDLINDPFEINDVADENLKMKYYYKLVDYACDWEDDHYFTQSFFTTDELQIIQNRKIKYLR